MWWRKATASAKITGEGRDDAGLIELFARDTKRAWDLFIERYADAIFGQLRGMGFDYDDAMDRFVYICEKLAEDDCRRLRSIRFAGQHGEMVPWVRTVVKNLCINWAWSQDGRKRLFKPIERLSKLDQRVFELYFWGGLTPLAAEEQLRREAFFEVADGTVFDALDRVIASLSVNHLWKLASGLLRARKAASFEQLSELAGVQIEAVESGPNPEESAAAAQQRSWLGRGLASLESRHRLVVQLRFEQALTLADIGRTLALSEREVKKLLDASLERLRKQIPRAPQNLSVERQ